MGTFGFTAEDARALIIEGRQKRAETVYQDTICKIKEAATEGHGSIDIEVDTIKAIQDYETLNTKVLTRLRNDGFIITLSANNIKISWDASPSGSPSGSEQ